MRTTFGRFDKGPSLHHSLYYIIFNCGSLTKFSLISGDLFRRSSGMPNLILTSQVATALLMVDNDNDSENTFDNFGSDIESDDNEEQS